jgi:DNA repair exonuclease SbcCD ATPase subunit
MLTVTLANFRKFENATFTFSNKFSLISGKSGKGKTTIFMAINFALSGYGKCLQSFGRKSCSVTLETNLTRDSSVVKIVRTKGPNRLCVYTTGDSDVFYEDKEGQAVINDLFPRYESGYMSQRLDHSKCFILMSPQDKMRFVEDLVCGSVNVDALVQNCKEMIKNRKHDLAVVSGQRRLAETMLESMNVSNVSSDDPFTTLREDSVLESEILSKTKELEILKEKYSQMKHFRASKKKILDKLESLPKKPDAEDLNELETRLSRIRDRRERRARYEKENRKLKELENDVMRLSGELFYSGQESDLKKILELKTVSKSRSDCKKKMVRLSTEIEQSRVTGLSCPNCSTGLALTKDGLIICEKITTANTSASPQNLSTMEELKRKEEVLAGLRKDLEKFTEDLKILETLKTKTRVSDFAEAEKKLETLRVVEKKIGVLEKQKYLCSQMKPEDDDAGDNLQIDEKVLKENISKMYERNELEKMLATMDKENNCWNVSKTDVEILESEIESLNREKESNKSRVQWGRVRDLVEKEKKLSKSYPRSVKLLEILKSAQMIAVSKLLEDINLHAQIYLDEFTDCELSTTLSFDGSKMIVSVFQNGNETTIHNLSGGELARVVLAFTIAFAEMCDAKFLLLDECLAALDHTTTEKVVKCIRNEFDGTVIFVAHQTTTGVFDSVLNLDEMKL